jgi:glyceraldehyde-3-phosphate dehydrogenase (NADP+)
LVGPIIDKGHFERIRTWVQEAKEGGAKVILGAEAQEESNNVYAATLLEGVQADAKICREEAFGPVAVLQSVPDFEAAIALANKSRYGLQAGVFTSRIDRMKQAFEGLEVGGVIMNNVPGFRVDGMPYGGIKDSGLGREGIRYAMEEMTEPRLLVW